MADYYQQFLSSMTRAAVYPASPGGIPQANQLGAGQYTTNYQPSGYFPSNHDPSSTGAPRGLKGRRKSNAGVATGIDHVKHRRTRSGCFMCRSRRVKCDERRPICERCKKGNRACVYPDPPASKGAPGQSSRAKDSSNTQQFSPMSSNEDEEEDAEPSSKLEPIMDIDEHEDSPPSFAHYSRSQQSGPTLGGSSISSLGRRDSETPSQDDNKSSSPSTSTITSSSFATSTFQASDFNVPAGGQPDLSHLGRDIQQHMAWFMAHVTSFHYCHSFDGDDFFKSILPSIAVTDEALLNALVGFSAYHTTLQDPNGDLADFLRYYNKSVTLLLGALKRKEKHTVATLLTILQLATIEEYLGDWVNLLGHTKAAFEIITSIFSPQNFMQTAVGRSCYNWYSRFDNFIALMGGFPTDLPREYFTGMAEYSQTQANANPSSIRWKADAKRATLTTITYDMSIVFAKGSRGQLSAEEFSQEHMKLTQRLDDWKNNWDPSLIDQSLAVMDFPDSKPITDTIVNPYTPGLIFKPPLFSTTLLTIEWHSIKIMHITQALYIGPEKMFAEMSRHAYATAQYFEALEFWPFTPKGVLIAIQACISIAAVFLPPDERNQHWVRRKLASTEVQGYIYPLSQRAKMAGHFRDPSCVRWWLPNDEGFTPVLQAIRRFADERNAVAVTAQQESVKEVKPLWANLEKMMSGK